MATIDHILDKNLDVLYYYGATQEAQIMFESPWHSGAKGNANSLFVILMVQKLPVRMPSVN